MPKYITQQNAADRLGVTPRTIRNWIARGWIPGYQLPGGQIRVSIKDIQTAASIIPAVRNKVQPFGPQATIVAVPAQAEVVNEGGA